MKEKINIVCIVQARMKSTRLPNKVMLDLAGKPVLFHVFNQLSFCKKVNKFVIATSTDKTDDILELWATINKISIYRGDMDNVLERYYHSAKKFKADVIVRVTSDCPLINPEIVDLVIEEFVKNKYDYVCNNNPPTFPEGYDVEVFSFKALKTAYESAIKKSDKEHVTPYIINNPNLFKQHSVINNYNYANYRFTLDRYEDYILMYHIFVNLYKKGKYIDFKQIKNFLDNNSNLIKLNSHIIRNEGYLKSLSND